MIILLLTTQEKVGERIAARLRSKYNYIVQVFTSARKFCEAAYDEGPARIDLLMVDYLSFLNDELNPFEKMVEMERVFPFIYYNTPFAKAGHRAEYWYNKIARHVKSCIPDGKVSDLVRLFTQIDDLVSSPDIQPYVRLLNDPLEISDEEEEEEEDRKLFLEELRKQYGIHNSRFRVLEYLYDRIGEDVMEEDICNDLWNEYSERKTGVLYSYISELRKICCSAQPKGQLRGQATGRSIGRSVGRRLLIERSGKRSYRMVVCQGEAEVS
ncbi:MAG: helix-turn-helix domain-containing protein [Treponema sp.]|nr:helix-turn-helix domain-containing protein [Treponema sp.]